MTDNKRFLLRRRPEGEPVETDFELVSAAIPAPPAGGFVLRNRFASLDPAQRGWMEDAPSYMPPIEEYSAVVPDGFTAKVDVSAVDSPSRFLSAFGAVGLTAYFGLLEVAKPQPGETVLVSGAAGAVGSVVGQIAKIHGCRTVGIAGGPDKCARLVQRYGYDAAGDYRGKSTEQLADAIREVTPDGANIVFENVGGTVFDAELMNLAKHARIVLCGLISEYNSETKHGARNLWQVLAQEATLHGYLISAYVDRFAEGGAQMAKWIASGEVVMDEDIQHGIDNAYPAFMRLFSGANTGKLILALD